MAELILIRHGETAWTRSGQHTGLTDLPLTPAGEDQARAAAKLIAGRTFAAEFTSPLIRAARTAELAGLTGATVEPDLVEWDYGGYEGLTSDQIQQTHPGWFLWDDGVVPGDAAHPGETVEQVGARCDRVLARVRPVLRDGEGEDVALVSSGHVLRVLCARWLGLPPSGGRFFKLDTATVSRLGFEHGHPVVDGWNQRAW
jgi:broad specificity phosphatase PhoE